MLNLKLVINVLAKLLENSWIYVYISDSRRKTRECKESSSCLCKDGHVYYVSTRASSVSHGINELTREHNGRQNAEYLLAYDANAASLLCMTITLPNSSLPMGVVYCSFQLTRLFSYTDYTVSSLLILVSAFKYRIYPSLFF